MKPIENAGVFNIILKLCISDVGYHILRKRKIFKKGMRERIVTDRLDGSNRRDGRNWRIQRRMMLLWQIQVIKHIYIKILIDVQKVVVIVVEAILLRSCIRSTRGDTCLR